MTDEIATQTEAGEGVDSARADLLSQLKTLHNEAKAEHHLDLPIPGYRKLLWARFRPFPVEKTEVRIRQFQGAAGGGNRPMALQIACDTLIDACEQLMLLPARFAGDIGEDGANLMPIDAEATPFIAFDQRLEPLFEIANPGGTARGVIVGLFPTEQSIVDMNIRIQRWMSNITEDVNDTLMGNF